MALRHGEVRPVAGRLASAGDSATRSGCADLLRASERAKSRAAAMPPKIQVRQFFGAFRRFGRSGLLRATGSGGLTTSLRSWTVLRRGLGQVYDGRCNGRGICGQWGVGSIVVFLPRSGNPTFRTNDTTATLRDTQVVGHMRGSPV